MFVNKNKLILNEEYEAYMKGWASKRNYEEQKVYYNDKFFKDFIYVKNHHSTQYTELFYRYLNPSFVITDEVINQCINYFRCYLSSRS